MKRILNWLLCHSVAIVVLLFVLVAILFKAQIFGLDSDSTAIESSPPLHPLAGVSATSGEPAATVEQSAEEVAQASQVPVTVEIQENVSVPESNVEEQGAQAVTEMPKIQTFPEEAKDKPEKIIEENDYQFRPKELEAMDELPVQQSLLQQARQAYWNDDLEKSRNLYKAYIELNPENPDGYGELGNLLSTLGDLNLASQMYQKAADLLIKQDQPEQAAKLLQVLDSIEVIQNSSK